MTARVGAVVLTGLLLFALSGCASSNSEVDSLSATYGLPSTQVDLEAETWVLVPAESSCTVRDDTPVTLVVDDDRVSGTAPCNVYNGDFDLDGDSVEITNVATTSRACGPQVMKAEAEYLAALEAVDTVDVSEDDLELSGDNDLQLTYRAFDAGDHLVGKWSIINVGNGEAIASVLPDTSPAVTFEHGDGVTIVTGCNNGSSSYTLEGDHLTIDPVRQTQKACSDRKGLMEQEAALTKALESAARVQIAPAKLTILDEQGDIALVAVRPAS